MSEKERDPEGKFLHDLSSPLGSTLLTLDALLEITPPGDPKRPMIERAAAALRRAVDLLNARRNEVQGRDPA